MSELQQTSGTGWSQRLRKKAAQGKLKSVLLRKIRPYTVGVRKIIWPSKLVSDLGLRLILPAEVKPDPVERPLVERLLAAFVAMRKDQQAEKNKIYLPSPAWGGILQKAYGELHAAADAEDPDRLHKFLANFGMWPVSLGFEGQSEHANAATSPIRRSWLLSERYGKQIALWRWFTGGRVELGSLDSPRIGNQPGVLARDGTYIDLNAPQNQILGELLAGLVCEIDRPVVADLGGGSGKTAEFLLRRLSHTCYLDFDLPEVVTIASYYLMRRFPDRPTLLYGEGEYSPAVHDRYDLIFQPSFVISQSGDVDLFVNRVSLGEMRKETAFQYVHHICAATTKWFFHMNHDGKQSPYEYGSERGPLASEYPIPSEKFRLLWRYADLGHLLDLGYLDTSQNVFMHLYQRK